MTSDLGRSNHAEQEAVLGLVVARWCRWTKLLYAGPG